MDDIKLADKTENIEPTWKILLKDIYLSEPTSLSTMFTWVALKQSETSNEFVANYEICWNRGFSSWSRRKNYRPELQGKPDAETIVSWSYDLEGHANKCVEIYCEFANSTTQQSHRKSQLHA